MLELVLIAFLLLHRSSSFSYYILIFLTSSGWSRSQIASKKDFLAVSIGTAAYTCGFVVVFDMSSLY